MKKTKYAACLFGILVLLLLFNVGCTQHRELNWHEHNWIEADCENPIQCTICGETVGEANGHNLTDATCTEPSQCTICGETVGEAKNHSWTIVTCTEPKHCKNCGKTTELLAEHIWISATCNEPKHCKKCGITEGDKTNHNWISATCEKPKHCSICNEIVGSPKGHSWSKGSSTKPKICKNCKDMRPTDLPKNGQVFIGKNLSRKSELTIKSKTSDSCYIKLKNSSGKDVFSFFVRAGCSATVSVPKGKYHVYFSYGNDWYGTEYIFGPDTTYSKDDELLDFNMYTWEYTLYPVYNGNFTETPIDANEFK